MENLGQKILLSGFPPTIYDIEMFDIMGVGMESIERIEWKGVEPLILI